MPPGVPSSKGSRFHLGHGAVKESGILAKKADPLAEFPRIDLAEIKIVEADAAALRLVKAQHDLQQG